MWKQNVAEFLQGIGTAAGRRGETAEQADRALGLLRNAQAFYFGDSTDSLDLVIDPLMGRPLEPVMRLPFPAVLYEYRMISGDEPEREEMRATRRAILVADTPEGQTTFSFWKFDAADVWTGSPIYTVAGGGEGLDVSEWFPMDGAEEWRKEQIWKEFNHDLTHVRALNSILECRNVVWKTVEPPERLNRKRVRGGREPISEYRILEVVKGRPARREAGRVPWGYVSPESVRFHLCRGHFKHFSEDRPLFGKWSGTFWWSPQARGTESRGRVEKEYRVRLEQDGDGGGPRP